MAGRTRGLFNATRQRPPAVTFIVNALLLARWTEPTPFAVNSDPFLMMTGLTLNAQKAVLETTALYVIFKAPVNVSWQTPTHYANMR